MEAVETLNIYYLGEYLDIEFKPNDVKFEYNLERIIDDFILFCVLVGNDFLPCLPFAEIGENGLDDLFRVYKDHLASASNSPWLTKNCGEVDFKQFLGWKTFPGSCPPEYSLRFSVGQVELAERRNARGLPECVLRVRLPTALCEQLTDINFMRVEIANQCMKEVSEQEPIRSGTVKGNWQYLFSHF